MEDYGLAHIWKHRVRDLGWSEQTQRRIVFHWAPSTIETYDRYIRSLVNYCQIHGMSFPPNCSSVLADFVCEISNRSDRPKSVINNTMAALVAYYDGVNNGENPARERCLRMLCDGLIKSGTKAPHRKTPVLPVKHFHDMFKSWSDNSCLSIKDLRLKAVTLLSLVAMLRPSDIAPHAKLYNSSCGVVESMTFNRNQVTFEQDKSMTILFHGIKNDYNRDGFQVRITPSEDPTLDPVDTLHCYIQRTNDICTQQGSVFLSLIKPYKGVNSVTIGKILCDSIKRAGLDTSIYSAKSFRPTGATISVQSGCDPDIIRHVGRWKSKEVFERHYVHSQAQDSFTDNILMS